MTRALPPLLLLALKPTRETGQDTRRRAARSARALSAIALLAFGAGCEDRLGACSFDATYEGDSTGLLLNEVRSSGCYEQAERERCNELAGAFEAGAACPDELTACDVPGLYTAGDEDLDATYASCRDWAELWDLGAEESLEPPVDPDAR